MKTVSGIMLPLLFIGMLTLAFDIQPVEASGTIYIRADGSVDPDTAPISSVDNITYTFTGNIYDEIVVNRSNVIVDGNGYTLCGSEYGYGFYLPSINNVTIQNTNIKKFSYGIRLLESSNNTISGNTVTANGDYGIYLYDSSNNTLSGNTASNNGYGIYLYDSSNNTLSGNVMNYNKYNLKVRGYELSHYMHSIDVSNLADGKPVYYLINQKDLVITSATYPQVGYLAFINSVNVTVEGLTLTNKGQGLLVAYTTNSRVTDNDMTNNRYSISLEHSSNNTLSGNTASNNGYGIYLYDSSNNILRGNSISNNDVNGIWLSGSSYNNISGNNITNNYCGIYLYVSSDNVVSNNMLSKNSLGIHLRYSNGSTVTENNISESWTGVVLDYSYGNTLTENTISETGGSLTLGGICLEHSNGNIIYHNNFINNEIHARSYEAFNTWDDSKGEGNYWSDHVCIGNPSDGSQPYIIDADNIDHYPFQDPNGWLLPPPPVGGKATPINIPMNKPETPTLWIWLTTIILSLTAAVVYVKFKKKKQ